MKHKRISALAAVAALIAAAPAVAQKSVRDGIEAWQRSDFAAAVAIWRPLAEKGSTDAAFNLGQAYRLGRGVAVDLAAAQSWLEKAAKAGHVDAQTTLGLLLFDSGNRASAMNWLQKAADKGEPRALLVYGTALFNGDGVNRDPVLAYAFVSRAAAQGLEPAKATLAEMDKLIPIEQRQKGVEIALAKATAKAPKASPQAKAAPAAKPADVASAPASGAWRIQLGAFSQRSSAEALYRRLSGSLGGRQAYYVPAGKVTRLQVGPFATRAAAASACAALKGQPCFPVSAK